MCVFEEGNQSACARAHLGQNGIMMSHCIGLKKIKTQFVLSSYAYNISLTLFSRCTSLIVVVVVVCFS